jgi:uncharacterized membrane protein (DUF373 family)
MNPTTNVIPLPTPPNRPETMEPQPTGSGGAAPKGGALRAFQLRNVRRLEKMFNAAVVLVLIAIAGLVLTHTIQTLLHDLASKQEDFSQVAASAVSGVLFAIIVMDLMTTVLADIERPGLALEPFLIIGIISAVREILSVGARMSLLPAGQSARGAVHLSLLELGANGALVFWLAISLVMIRRLAGPRSAPAGETE